MDSALRINTLSIRINYTNEAKFKILKYWY